MRLLVHMVGVLALAALAFIIGISGGVQARPPEVSSYAIERDGTVTNEPEAPIWEVGE